MVRNKGLVILIRAYRMAILASMATMESVPSVVSILPVASAQSVHFPKVSLVS